jgi:hypothetical protein
MTEGPRIHQPPQREFYERLALEKSAEIKFRLYSLDQYQSELGGDAGALERERFVGALKAYRWVDGEWYDYPPQKAEDLLRLEPGDYEIDEERRALLFRRVGLTAGIATKFWRLLAQTIQWLTSCSCGAVAELSRQKASSAASAPTRSPLNK